MINTGGKFPKKLFEKFLGKFFGNKKCNEVRKLKNVACTVNRTVVSLSSSGYTMSSVTG